MGQASSHSTPILPAPVSMRTGMVAIHELGTDGNRSRGLVEGQEPWDACWESKNGKGHVCRSSGASSENGHGCNRQAA